MFDLDGTLVESTTFDSLCFEAAVKDVLDTPVENDLERYVHVTDTGILNQIIDGLRLQGEREAIFAAVKQRFIEHVADYLAANQIAPIPGAREFLERLAGRRDVRVAIATGGWRETARLKLQAVGMDLPEVPLASSSDHFSRIEIMKIAESRCGGNHYQSKTYFGDAPWDMRASTALGYNFILVGNRIAYHRSIADYTAAEEVLTHLGL